MTNAITLGLRAALIGASLTLLAPLAHAAGNTIGGPGFTQQTVGGLAYSAVAAPPARPQYIGGPSVKLDNDGENWIRYNFRPDDVYAPSLLVVIPLTSTQKMQALFDKMDPSARAKFIKAHADQDATNRRATCSGSNVDTKDHGGGC